MAGQTEIQISDCTRDIATCPVFKYVNERNSFEVIVSSIDAGTAHRVEVFGKFITACANGDCPGQDPELTRQIIRENRQKDL